MQPMITAYFDGACWPNPGGTASAGVFISALLDNGKSVLLEDGYEIGTGKAMSSNVAEYAALIRILEFLVTDYSNARILIRGDSVMVIKQMQGLWKVKHGLYVDLANKAKALIKKFTDISFKWIPRDKNERCDTLAALAI